MTDLINRPLYKMPSFTKGAARTVALFGHMDTYETVPNSKEADVQALANDWKTVGADLKNAIKTYGRTHTK